MIYCQYFEDAFQGNARNQLDCWCSLLPELLKSAGGYMTEWLSKVVIYTTPFPQKKNVQEKQSFWQTWRWDQILSWRSLLQVLALLSYSSAWLQTAKNGAVILSTQQLWGCLTPMHLSHKMCMKLYANHRNKAKSTLRLQVSPEQWWNAETWSFF